MPPENKVPITDSRELSRKAVDTIFMKEHMPLKEIMLATRERFAEIDELLRQEVINRHDQGHQLRTAVNTVSAMRQIGIPHREVLQAAFGALVHDVGYNQQDHASAEELQDEHLGGKKAQFKKHALYGAREVHETLTQLLEMARADASGQAAQAISFKNKHGQPVMMDEEDVYRITEAILNHNDYGKDDVDYDPRKIGRGALMVQLFDKLDICRDRVYPEHMQPEVFDKKSDKYDEKNCHRVAPFCVSDYEWKIDVVTGKMKMTYNVDTTEFEAMMTEYSKDHDEPFVYNAEKYERDFLKAYEKNARIAAEAIGTIMGHETDEPMLEIELKFTDSSKILNFARPKRDVYKRTESLRASLAEMIGKRAAA